MSETATNPRPTVPAVYFKELVSKEGVKRVAELLSISTSSVHRYVSEEVCSPVIELAAQHTFERLHGKKESEDAPVVFLVRVPAKGKALLSTVVRGLGGTALAV